MSRVRRLHRALESGDRIVRPYGMVVCGVDAERRKSGIVYVREQQAHLVGHMLDGLFDFLVALVLGGHLIKLGNALLNLGNELTGCCNVCHCQPF